RGKNSVLISGAGPTEQFERAQIRGNERETGDPGGHFATGHKEVFAGFGKALEIKADPQNKGKVEADDDHIDRREMDQVLTLDFGRRCHRVLATVPHCSKLVVPSLYFSKRELLQNIPDSFVAGALRTHTHWQGGR